jgi:hypothetical protein
VDEFAPMSLVKEIFHNHSLFDSIYQNIHRGPSRKSQISINKCPRRQTLWTYFLAEHIWLIQKLIKFWGCYSAIDNSQSWER